jgi:carboxylesterase
MKSIYFILFTILAVSCSKTDKMPPIDNAVDLDGTVINDSSLAYPSHFLQSARTNTPSELEKNTPVYLCVHGYSATTFEWIEFRDFVKQKGGATTSLVLLGGHGRDYADFKSASWKDWQATILDEINKLTQLGYKNLYLVGSSTACSLILDALNASKLPTTIKGIYFIDPIIVPSNKTLSLVNGVGPMLGYTTTEFETGEVGFWYKYRPYQSLKQLNTVTQEVRKQLEAGIACSVPLTVYKSSKDGSADPISAVLIDKGIKMNENVTKNIEMIESELHVFTRLRGRNSITTKDIENQQSVFNKLINASK